MILPSRDGGALMRKMAGLALLFLCLSGCAEVTTKWECVGSCMSREQAYKKCLTEANLTVSSGSRAVKATIWEQCMRGEGFREVRCTEADTRNPAADCRASHEF